MHRTAAGELPAACGMPNLTTQGDAPAPAKNASRTAPRNRITQP
ncbi:hypothetical protein C7S16_3762 [Burkholderia thailandensis]|uniref:Uncharacterized protein n=1 Tax=Burkholderia thailandensis TaxID=57975 RepID=A0AAW9D266_BURTH|nr:hypothetical protein [Burkholderia thailandensis]MDW9255628.1 hypothetical protein [Burkholderia thailandensis]